MTVRILECLSLQLVGRPLMRGALISFILQAIGAGLIFFSEVLVARVLGVPAYGVFATIMAWLQVLIPVAMLGTNYLLLRMVPVYVENTGWPQLRGMLRWCLGVGLLGSSIIYAIMFFAAVMPRGILDAEIKTALMLGMLALPLYVLSLQRQAILRGLHRVAHALSPEYVIRPLILIILVALFAWGAGHSLSPDEVLGLNVIAAAAAFLVGWFWQHQARPDGIKGAVAVFHNREWFSIAIPLFLVALMQLLIVRMDIILLGALLGREQAGIYAAASRVADLVVFGLAAANVVVAPIIASLYTKNDIPGLQRMLTALAKGVSLFTGMIVILLLVAGQWILQLFGGEFVTAFVPMLILGAAQMMNALLGPVDFMLAMTGHQKQSLRIFFIATILNIALHLSLIPLYGMIGAAAATFITLIFWKLFMLIFIRRTIGVEASILAILSKST